MFSAHRPNTVLGAARKKAIGETTTETEGAD
jgi:hypothetical protein